MSEVELENLVIESHKGPYEAYFDDNALANLAAAVPENAHFIIDARLAELYGTEMANVLAAPSVLQIEAREDNKSLERFPDYVEHLVDRGLRRGHMLIAIGGGIIQDITCFLAATMLRGVDWTFYPTTLLAQADSCIGSKSSINCGSTKNILGTFTPPRGIYVSTRFLQTLDERDVRSGIGEMMKVQVIDGPASFDAIAVDYQNLFDDPSVMARYIRKSLLVKQGYIEKDEFDQGPRNIFNYGHSFGHAIEAATGFAIPHGIAITIGMDMANYTAWKLGIGSEDNYHRMSPTLKKNYRGFETHPVAMDVFTNALSKDKKNVGHGSVTLILPGHDGMPFREAYPSDENFLGLCTKFLERERAGL